MLRPIWRVAAALALLAACDALRMGHACAPGGGRTAITRSIVMAECPVSEKNTLSE